VLSEGRKFGVGTVLSQQLLAQQSAETRDLLSGVGTQIFFQLSSPDAQYVSNALDGGRPLAERLKNLPQRHCVVKSGSDRWVEVCVPTVQVPKVDYTDLLNRSRYARGRVRAHIERDIAKRQEILRHKPDEVLHDWE
jgi:DNA helicase HerA-like ATPase